MADDDRKLAIALPGGVGASEDLRAGAHGDRRRGVTNGVRFSYRDRDVGEVNPTPLVPSRSLQSEKTSSLHYERRLRASNSSRH
jgi:hypothetical protein